MATQTRLLCLATLRQQEIGGTAFTSGAITTTLSGIRILTKTGTAFAGILIVTQLQSLALLVPQHT